MCINEKRKMLKISIMHHDEHKNYNHNKKKNSFFQIIFLLDQLNCKFIIKTSFKIQLLFNETAELFKSFKS